MRLKGGYLVTSNAISQSQGRTEAIRYIELIVRQNVYLIGAL